MNIYLQQGGEKLRLVFRALYRFWLMSKRLLQEQFNKNLYTRILFTNVTAFVIAMIALMMFSSFEVKQVTYDQIQQELLREAKRVNFALLQQTDRAWSIPPDQRTSSQVQAQQDFLKYLAGIFDAKITIFDMAGKITATSAEQEMVPGSKIDDKFLEMLKKDSNMTTRTVDYDTGQPTFAAVVPMGNNKDAINNGILLETKSSNLDLALSKMRLYLVSGGMVILLIIIFISVYLAMHISRPISRLTATVAEINRGSYILNDKDQPLDEINDLGGQLNKLAERLQKIQTESRRMEEERDRLFAEISHELRTPLTAVQGFVEALRDGIVQDEAIQERYLDTIHMQTVHISRLVDDILKLSRLESGNITVEKLPVDLNALAHGVAMSMEPVANRRNTSILVDRKAEEAIVLGDADRMEQIIRNLMKNAIRATVNGTIRVGVETRQNKVLLSIEDNGIGISPEDLPHIWERFYRIKNQRDDHLQEKGSGLGLVIVKKLVQLQGGNIDVTSHLGKGTTFHISFPSFGQI
ncbi:ATP-binding protein [Desulfitobacterium sp. AusDCA]|uniref:sensor histidine kinase n=1 Tax=Desulfitobacterium sp. AusDCA TaxID=3240383 RepID=UPI003DA74746